MATIEHLMRTAANVYQWTPWQNAVVGSGSIVANPTISGTLAPGQRLTANGGSYLPAGSGTTFRRYEWTIKRASDGALLAFWIGPYYDAPSTLPRSTVELVEKRFGAGGLPIEGKVTATIEAAAGAPQFGGVPTLTISGTGIGAVLTVTDPPLTGSPAPTRTRVWKKDGVVLSGVTGTSHTAAALGEYTVEQTGANGTLPNAGPVISNAVSVVAATGAPQFSAAPTMVRNATTGQYSAANAAVTSTLPTTVVNRWYYGDSASGPWTYRGSLTSDPNRWVPVEDFAGKFITCASFATNSAAPNGVESPKATPIQIPALPTEGFKTQPSTSGNQPQGSVITLDPGTYYGTPQSVENQWFRISSTGVATTLSTTGLTRTSGADDKDNTLANRVKITYANGNVYYAPSATTYTTGVLVTSAVVLAWPALAGFSGNGSILTKGRFDYTPKPDGYVPEQNNPQWGMGLQTIGYEAWRGNTAADAQLIARLERWTQPNTSPCMAGGYQMQHMANFATNAAYARNTPRIWDALSTGVQNRLTALMRLALWTIGLWREGTENFYTMMGANNATTAGLSSNPNISCAPSYVWYAAAWFFGGISNALTYIANNTIADLIATMGPVTTARPNNLNLANPYGVWSVRASGAPTIADVQSRARTRQRRRGINLTDPEGVLCAEIDHTCRLAAVRGVNGGAGLPDNEYYNGSDSSDYVSTTMRNKFPGHTKEGRMIKDPAVVAPARWTAIKDKIGMIAELDTNDGNPGRRSSITYAWKAHPSCYGHAMLQFNAGFVKPGAKAIKERRSKLFVGAEYMWLASPSFCGYDGVAHIYAAQPGKPNTIGKHGNANNLEPGDTAEFERYALACRLSLSDAVVAVIDAAPALAA